MSKGRKGLGGHERDTGRRDREMEGGGEEGLQDWEEEKKMTEGAIKRKERGESGSDRQTESGGCCSWIRQTEAL